MSDSDRTHRLMPSVEDNDVYKLVSDTRNFEISLFWQRSNYFLALNSALAVGFFNIKIIKYQLFLAIFGLYVVRTIETKSCGK
jgi:hypothetical protein